MKPHYKWGQSKGRSTDQGHVPGRANGWGRGWPRAGACPGAKTRLVSGGGVARQSRRRTRRVDPQPPPRSLLPSPPLPQAGVLR